MNDLNNYIQKRKTSDEEFKIGEMLKQARVEVELTQEDLALQLHTKELV